jgi:hypothetical protein
VIAAGDDKVAVVGTDLGSGPTEAMMAIICRQVAERAGIRHVRPPVIARPELVRFRSFRTGGDPHAK